LAWTVRLSPSAIKQLSKLDKTVAKRITDYLAEVSLLKDVRSKGKGLTGRLAGLWRYRIGDYRAICDIQDDVLVVVVIAIGHRSDVYD